MARVKILWHSANAWPTNLDFKKLLSKRKKSFKWKCCHEAMVDNCYKLRVALQITAREVKFDPLVSCSGREKSFGTTDVQSCNLKIF